LRSSRFILDVNEQIGSTVLINKDLL